MLTGKNKVQVKPKCRHGRLHADYNAKSATGNPGPYAMAGDIITVSDQELRDFGDKFIVLDSVTAVLSKPSEPTPASIPEPASVEETARQRRVADLEAANNSLQNDLAVARAHVLKSEQSAKRARATLKSERKKSQAVKALDKPSSDTVQVKA